MPLVQAGQNLSSIAAQAGMTPAQFAAANPQFAATGPNSYQGLTNNVAVGASYVTTPAVVTATPAVNAVNNASTQLNNATNTITNNQQNTPPTQPPSTNINLGNNKPEVDPFQSQLSEIDKSAAQELSSYQNIFNLARQTLDTQTNSTIANIQAIYDKRKTEMKSVNDNALALKRVSGLVSGRDRYAQDFQTDVLTNEERDGIKRIADLDAEANSLIVQAQNARDAKDMEILIQSMQQYDKINENKKTAINDLYKQALDLEKIAIDKAQEKRAQLKDDLANQEKYASNLAASIYDSLTGDPKADQEFIVKAAADYGIDPNFLSSAVTQFKLDQNKALPTDLREYELMKQNGQYSGTFFNYLRAKKNAETIAKSSGSSSGAKNTVTSEDINRYNLPSSLAGRTDQSVIEDLAVSRVPQWFKDFLSQTEADKTFDTAGLQSVWNNFRSSGDMMVYRRTIDLDKTGSGKLDSQNGLLVEDDISSLFN